ncbi:hypothetical protein C1Y63_10275 [Corynebacterium sp. 13CS0277]|uniref:histidine phosphatase family protein n=1 Tax=Corynebacterium sp. 13CS0277 TaxID=2071994 RepID=UPI000D033CD5|nr:histidine phosphatase family protein [Corynebacterium sp. 13CS0277]PRQ10671.1 hypothetical protein C1Y63_10275 [Corynebacterium sp. 13CS0277]
MTWTVVHLVAVGEVDNPHRLAPGWHMGFPLTETGVAHAQRIAALLSDHDVVYLSASPLSHARDTAQIFSRVLGLPIGVDEGLLEVGDMDEGQRQRRIARKEPSADVYSRLMDAVERAHLEADGHEAVLITHPQALGIARRHLGGRGPLVSIVFDGERIAHVV